MELNKTVFKFENLDDAFAAFFGEQYAEVLSIFERSGMNMASVFELSKRIPAAHFEETMNAIVPDSRICTKISVVFEILASLQAHPRNHCIYRFRCRKGLTCSFSHTDEERAFFNDPKFRTADARLKCKTALCFMKDRCVRGTAHCAFAHGPEDVYCRVCQKWGHFATALHSCDETD